jgi:hypothetical protein
MHLGECDQQKPDCGRLLMAKLAIPPKMVALFRPTSIKIACAEIISILQAQNMERLVARFQAE